MNCDSDNYQIFQEGYTPVSCKEPMPCPFCGGPAVLVQLAHRTQYERIGRSKKFRTVKICILASSQILKADTFWFKCSDCGCTTGPHHSNALEASNAWNRRVTNKTKEAGL